MCCIRFKYFKSVVILCVLIYATCFIKANAQTDQKVENGSATEASVFPAGNCAYSWTNSNPSIGLAASGIGDIPSFTVINKTNSPVVATITAVPIQSQLAYIPSFDGKVAVISTNNNTVLTTVQAGAVPWGVAASKDGRRVYITNSEANTVTVINTADNAVIATITVGANPHGIAVTPDGSKVYVANTGPSYVSGNGPNTVSVINSTTNKVDAIINVGKTPVGVAVSPDGSKAYVTNYYSNTVSVINTATNKVTAEFNGGSSSWGITVSADGSLLYISNPGTGSVSFFNTSNNVLQGSVQTEGSVVGIALTPDGKYAYVANASLTRLDVIDLRLSRRQQSISLNSSPSGVSISADGSRVYVTDYNSNNVVVISTATNTVINTISISAPAVSIGNFLSAGVPCIGKPVTFEITVEPSPLPHNIIVKDVSGTITACEGTVSAAPNIMQFNVSAAALTADVTVTAPANFEISRAANTGFGNTLQLSQTGGNVQATIIYVRAAAGATAGTVNGSIVLSSTGVASESVPVTAKIDPLPMADKPADQTFFSGLATKEIKFSGTANTFTWTNDRPDIGLAAAGTGDIASFNAVNNTSSPITATITVMPSSPGLAYITNFDGSDISVINTSTHKIVGSIPSALTAIGVAVYPAGNRAYFTNGDNNKVSFVDIATNKIVNEVTTGNVPWGAAIGIDGRTLYVTNFTDNTVSVINTITAKEVTAIPVGLNPKGITISPDGSRLYVANSGSKFLTVISTASNSVIATVPVPDVVNATCMVLSPDGKKLYLTGGKIFVIDTQTNAVTGSIEVGFAPFCLAISPDGHRLYVTNANSDSVSAIDTETNTVIAEIPVGKQPEGISITSDGATVYAVNYRSNNVSVINTSTNTVVDVIPVGPFPMSFGNFITGGSNCIGVPVSFTITIPPASASPLILASADLKPLHTIYGTPSVAQQFTVSGVKLTGGILITPPAGFELSADNLTYGNTLTVGGTATVNNATVYVRLAKTTHVGTYTGDIVLSSPGATNVDVPIPPSVVSPAPLTITADNKTRLYGTDNPAFTVSYNGFVNNESAAQLSTAPVVTTTATITSAAGVYPITASGAVAADYAISYLPGTLTITPVGQQEQGLTIPTGFTPNGDGVNDKWEIAGMENYPKARFSIFNRYGQPVYTGRGVYKAWDGTYKGSQMPAGVYYYIIDLKNNAPALSGYVLLLR
jgi:gliding motility-associated-like protein